MQKLASKPLFDKEEPFATVIGDSNLKFCQNGHYYDAHHNYVGSDDTAAEGETVVVAKKRKTKKAAAPKLGKYTGPDLTPRKAASTLGGVPREVQEANRENARAAQAEELAE